MDKDMTKKILPAGPLMKEHRLIERMVKLVSDNLKRIQAEREPDLRFLRHAVDFFRVYADKAHHGKEEDILFRALSEKKISAEHKEIMESLIEDHKKGRKYVTELKKATGEYTKGDRSALERITGQLKNLAELYPQHIDTEDKRFFLPVMEYFGREEMDEMLDRFNAFDQGIIHRIYQGMLDELEKKTQR